MDAQRSLNKSAESNTQDLDRGDAEFFRLTIVAAGTGAPELFASIAAIRRGSASMAVGNVVGSNLFNTIERTSNGSEPEPCSGTIHLLSAVTETGSRHRETDRGAIHCDILLLAGVSSLLVGSFRFDMNHNIMDLGQFFSDLFLDLMCDAVCLVH